MKKRPREPDADPVTTDFDYEDLSIDRDSLETELSDQASKFYEISKLLALAISKRDEASNDAKETEATAKDNLRRDVERDERKMSVDAMNAEVRIDRSVRNAHAEVLRLTDEVNKLSAAKEAWRMRSYMLSQLAELWVSNYYQSGRDSGVGESKGKDDQSARTTIRDTKAARARDAAKAERASGKYYD